MGADIIGCNARNKTHKMSLEEKETENLFSYGTLQTEAVQLATFGRSLEGKPDMLVGYSLKMIQIEDQKFVALSGAALHRNLQFTGIASDLVEGMVFTVTRKELEQADVYEPAEYKRVFTQLRSGMYAWVYIATRLS
jgi:Gamma-glutamyl cyclotransferase, AIG2-like